MPAMRPRAPRGRVAMWRESARERDETSDSEDEESDAQARGVTAEGGETRGAAGWRRDTR